MNTTRTNPEYVNTISADDAWRYSATERSAMITAGYAFEIQESVNEERTVPTLSEQRITEYTEVFHDKFGNIIDAKEANRLRFVYTNIDAQWKENGLGERGIT